MSHFSQSRRQFLAAVGFSLLLGCGPRSYSSREHFEQAVIGLSADRLREVLGSPDRITGTNTFPEGPGPKFWFYSGRLTKEPNLDARIMVEHDRVLEVTYMTTNLSLSSGR